MSVGLPPGCRITESFASGAKLRHDLYIDRATQDECKAVFDAIHTQKETFEAVYGRALSWERLDSNKASRIAEYRPGSVEQSEHHEEYIAWFIDAGDRMRKALSAVAID